MRTGLLVPTLLVALLSVLAGCPGEDGTAQPPCAPRCDGRTCGDDGCGGSCGECEGACLDGTCCLPDCDGRTCGDDGCGGTCGECEGGPCLEGTCCTPQCEGRTCGDDGCGGSCGACPDACSGAADAPALCVDGTCTQACCPDCEGKACGDDGCGGSCGICLARTCFQGACCRPSCEGKICGDDGCGGSCGGCDEGLECREGACKVPCGRIGYEPKSAVSSWKPYGSSPDGTLFYQAVDAEGSPTSVLTLDIRQAPPFHGPLGPGTYPFATTKYSKCDICVRLSEDCSDKGCARQYLATEGVLEVKALDRADGPFEAVLHDVLFREALIDLDWASWVPPSGQTWCVDDVAVKADEVKLAVPQPTCQPDSQDVLVDQNIGDFTLTNCLGDRVNLHSLCGRAKAVWFLLVAAWCPYCKEYAPQANAAYEAKKPAVQLMTILGEDTAGNAPDVKDCQAFASSHGLDPAWTFIDSSWQITAAHIYPYGFQGIPYEMVLDGDNMAYIWSTGQRGDLGTVLESLVAL